MKAKVLEIASSDNGQMIVKATFCLMAFLGVTLLQVNPLDLPSPGM